MHHAEPERSKITALIPACNEESHIRPCLASVAWADEIFVVDSFSEDATPQIAREMGLPNSQVETITTAALLHDIGKVSFRTQDIIDSPGRMTQEQRERMAKHPVIGAEIVSRIRMLKDAAECVRTHHERVDGLGYPDGLIGDQVPLGAQILGIAHFYVWDLEADPGAEPNYQEVMERMNAESGKRFDPSLLKVFLEAVGEWALVDLDQFRVEVGNWLSEAVPPVTSIQSIPASTMICAITTASSLVKPPSVKSSQFILIISG